ncbi:MAG: type II toxin-antitoxin system HipA family toxin [Treponema sp.]|nr:type II toxin-antitoxin system HipA family toxin [Treponema sp.]
MINTAEIFLWGTRIAIIHLEPDSSTVTFEYDKDFLNSNIQVSPLKMPLSNRLYSFPTLDYQAFHGLPGLLADSLPDKFGNAVINQWLASLGKTERDFNALDRLCYTGKRGMGALEFQPANSLIPEIDENVNVSEMVNFASDVLSKRKSVKLTASQKLTYSQLLQMGTSAGGARAKAVLAWNEKTNEIRSGQLLLDKDFDYWLMKFDGVKKNGDHGLEDYVEYTLIEYAYYKMALDAGIQMSECRIYSENENNHFMTKRFDRVNGKKLHMQTLGALAHINYNEPGLCSYEQAAGYMRELNLSADEIEQFFRRMVFNVLAVNQDDHVKNVSFLMDKSGKWKLSPAYDITFSYDQTNRWLSAHQMLVNGKKDHITQDDLIISGKNMDISLPRIKSVISEVKASVSKWPEFASSVGIRKETFDEIQEIISEEMR